MPRNTQRVSVFLLTFTTIIFFRPASVCASSYSLVSALHGISANETVVVGQTNNGSLVSRGDSGSQSITPNWTWNYAASSSASAQDGLLRGSSFIDMVCANQPYCDDTPINSSYSYHSVTQASYGDTLTVSSALHNGETGYAQFSYHLDGSITLTQLGAQTDVYGQLTFCNGFCGATNVISSIYYRNSSTDEDVLLATIPFTYGTPFSFGANLFTRAQATYTSGTLALVYLQSDFHDTATFEKLGVYTSSGALVSDAVVTSDSGYNYNAVLASSTAPEPSAVGLVGMAIVVFLFWPTTKMRRRLMCRARRSD